MNFIKSIFIIVLFFCTLSANNISSTKNQDNISILNNLTDSLIKINLEIAKTQDENNISSLIKKKDTLLKEFALSIQSPTLKLSKDIKSKQRLEFLTQRISINNNRGNIIAVLRDKLEIYNINQYNSFIQYIQDIRKLYKKKYDSKKIEKLSNDFIKNINYDISLMIQQSKKLHKNSNNQVINDFFKNLEIFQNNNQALKQIAQYLIQNSDQFINNNFVLRALDVNYIVNSINSLPILHDINSILDYHFGIKLGKIIFALIVILIVFTITNYTIPYILKVIQSRFLQFTDKSKQEYLFKKVILKPLKLILWLFAISTSLDITLEQNIFTIYFNVAYILVIWYSLNNILNHTVVLLSSNLSKKKNLKIEMVNLLITASKMFIFIIAVLLVLKQFGYDISAILASLGVGGLALALAAKDTLTNLFGSISIIFDNSFSQGDWIQTDEVEGTVIDIGVRTTTIRTFANAYLTVPNSYLANTSITNWSKREVGRRIKLKIGITYESKKEDIQNAVVQIREYLSSNPNIAYKYQYKNNISTKSHKLIKQEDFIGVKDTLLVYVDEYNSSSIDILVYCFSKTTNWEEWLKVKEEVLYKIWDIIENNNLEFAYPTQKVFLDKNLE